MNTWRTSVSREKQFVDLLLPACLTGGDHDPRACLGVRIGLMMGKRDVEMPADIGELRREQAPDRAGNFHRADERPGGPGQAVGPAARFHHPAVERCIVRREKINSAYRVGQERPELGEGGCFANIVPRQAVDVGKGEQPVRRPDQVMFAPDDAASLHDNEAYGTGTVGAKVRGLEIDGGKGGHDSGQRDACLMVRTAGTSVPGYLITFSSSRQGAERRMS